MELNYDDIEIDLKQFNSNYDTNSKDDFDKEIFKFTKEIENNLEKSCIKFEYGEIVDKETVEFILGSKANFIPEDNKYTLITRIIKSEYEYFYAVVPYTIDDNNQSTVHEIQITDLDGVSTTIKANDYYSKHEIINLIINNKLLIGVSRHFCNPESIGDIGDCSEFDEILEYYKDSNNFKQRWIQHDYLATTQ
jgi:hypothetical protein